MERVSPHMFLNLWGSVNAWVYLNSGWFYPSRRVSLVCVISSSLFAEAASSVAIAFCTQASRLHWFLGVGFQAKYAVDIIPLVVRAVYALPGSHNMLCTPTLFLSPFFLLQFQFDIRVWGANVIYQEKWVIRVTDIWYRFWSDEINIDKPTYIG